MIQIILTCLLITVTLCVAIYAIFKLAFELLNLINITRNKNRIYHIIAFFGTLIAGVFICITFIHLLVETVKLLD